MPDSDYHLATLWMSATPDPGEHELDQEAEKTQWETSNPEGVTYKNISLLLQPTLPDINDFSRRRSSRVVKPSEKAKQLNDLTL